MIELTPAKKADGGDLSKIEAERTHFKALLLQNPNYFGNVVVSPFKPVLPNFKAKTSYEQLTCVGLNPPLDRLEAVLEVKREQGYGGDICSTGSKEYVRFYVETFDDGVLHDVGLASVRVHDIPGAKPLCYAVYKDFSALRKFCVVENIVRVRAILQWNVPPPPDTPGYAPVWGNVLNANVQIHPRKFVFLGDLFKDGLEQIKLPDPIEPIVKQLDLTQKLVAAEVQPLALADKQKLYARADVPVHRFAFPEAQKLLALPDPGSPVAAGQSALVNLGLAESVLGDLLGKLMNPDGDTSFEELTCVGLKPSNDTLEAVLTLKKASGYSGQLCGKGSTEYVAFWIDFGEGGGFEYQGTATVNVHDLATLKKETVQYAVLLQKDLTKHRIPCQAGARVVRVRAILSWETPPPPGNPNYVPVWGNREECLVQLRPGNSVGHAPTIETVGDVGVDDIDPTTGLATGNGVIGLFSVSESPFGGTVTLTGRIANPPDSFLGGPPSFKYRVEVKQQGSPTWQPLLNTVPVKISEVVNSQPVEYSPGVFVTDTDLIPTDDSDGLGEGWYPYLEDFTGDDRRFLVVDKLASWETNASMEGLWHIRIRAKDPSTTPPTEFPGTQVVTVRIDNTGPTGPAGPGATQAQIEANPPLQITGATFQGNPIPAAGCGKFPVGTVLAGTYEVHDPGVSSPDQHFGALSLDVIPDGPANGAAPVPSSRSYPAVSTNGEAGTWTLDTSDMDPCGYVLRILASDRANVDSRGNPHTMYYDVGFCLIPAP